MNTLLFKSFTFASLLTIAYGRILNCISDNHGCYTCSGYVWCEALNDCIRPWETLCVNGTINT